MKNQQIPTIKAFVDGTTRHDYHFMQKLDAINRMFSTAEYMRGIKQTADQNSVKIAVATILKLTNDLGEEYYKMNEMVCNIFSKYLPTIDFSPAVDAITGHKINATLILAIVKNHKQADLLLEVYPNLLASYKNIATDYVTCIKQFQTGLILLTKAPSAEGSIKLLEIASEALSNFVPSVAINADNYLKNLDQALKGFDFNQSEVVETICNNEENSVDLAPYEQVCVSGDVIVTSIAEGT